MTQRARVLVLASLALVPLLLPHLKSATAEGRPPCGGTVCAGESGTLDVGDVEITNGDERIAHNAPDPIYSWRLVNPCIGEDGNLGGCTPQPDCPAAPDQIVHNFLIQYRLIAAGPGAPWASDGVHCVDITELQPTVTPAMVQAEFEQLPLPPGVIDVQPASGPVIVNAGAILFTTQPDQQPYDVVILGQAVHIDAFITDYAWHLGDGSPDLHGRGAPYPDKTNLHVYTTPGTVTVVLTLTWDATYTVDGGPVQDMPDTTTTDSPPLIMTVAEARSVLVDSF